MNRRDVRETYDRIAAHFAATREYAWPEVEAFLDEHAADGAAEFGLDVGCGNGRHAEALSEHVDHVVALDVSRGVLDAAQTRSHDRGFDVTLLQADATTLPIADDTVDVAVYVATLHHLPSRKERVASLDELARVLDEGGRGLVSAWSTAHERFDADEGFDTTIDWTLPDGEVVGRFYHIYDAEEFADDLETSVLEPIDVFVSSGNCYAVVEAR